VDNISLSRITTWTGVYGVSFEIMLVNVAVAAAFLVPRKKRSTLLIASLAAAAVLQAGRLVDVPALPADHAALLVQENLPVDATWTQNDFERTLRELADLSVKDAASSSSLSGSSGALESTPGKADLIVWPESPAPFFANDPLFRNPVSGMARETHTWVVTGSIGSTSAGFQLGSAHQSFWRLDRALRQSAFGAVRRISAVPSILCFRRRTNQRGWRVW
jgi:apolipoprotein N-acyltransferase